MITSLTPITLSHDQLLPAAEDLHHLVCDPSNNDLVFDFQPEYKVLARSVNAAYGQLVHNALIHETGEYEQFLISVQGESQDEQLSPQTTRFIGIASLCIAEPKFVPEMINADTPNLAAFICKPFRGRGIGKTVMRQLLDIVETNFHGEAWTLIRQANVPSQKIAVGAGFTQVGEGVGPPDKAPVNFYTYRSPSAPQCQEAPTCATIT